MGKKNESLKYEDVLMETFGFSEESLEANSRGELTSEQAKTLSNQAAQARAGFVVSAAAFIGAIIGSALGLQGGIALAVLIGSAVIGLFLLSMWWAYSDDARKHHVESVEGAVRLSLSDSGQGASNYKIRIGKQEFGVSKKKFLAIKNGDPYRIYYLPRSKKLLGIEWLYSDRLRERAFVEDGESAQGSKPAAELSSDGEVVSGAEKVDESISLSELLEQGGQQRSHQG